MANSWAASLPTVGANNGGNVTLTFSSLVNAAGAGYTLVQDDVVIAAFASSGTVDYAMPTPTGGWTALGEHYANGTIDTNVAVFAKKMGASPDASVTFVGPGGASNGTIGVAMVLKGADITTLDVAAVLAAGTATSVPNPGSVTPVTTGAFICVVGAGAAGTGAAFTNPGDLATTTNHYRSGNHAETNDIAIFMGFKENWTSGAFDPAAQGGGNVNAANSWAAVTLAIKPAVNNTTVTVTAGTLALTGQSIVVNKTAVKAIAAATMAYTGQSITAKIAKVIEIFSATMTRTGQTIVVNSQHVSSVVAATLVYAGQNVAVVQGLRILVSAAQFVYSGMAVLVGIGGAAVRRCTHLWLGFKLGV